MSTHRLEELSLLVVICLIHCYTNSCHGQLTSPGQAQGQCEYRFQVSSPVDCSRTDPALEQAIDLIKQDIDRSRLTFVGQNSAVQKQIADLKTTLDRVDTDVDTVKTQLAFGQSGDLVHKDEFKQLQKEVHDLNLVVVNIRDNMDRQITFLQGFLGLINSSLTSEKVERFKIEAGLQSQINDQRQVISTLEQRVKLLESSATPTQVPNTTSTTSKTSSTATATAVNISTLKAGTNTRSKPHTKTTALPTTITSSRSGTTSSSAASATRP